MPPDSGLAQERRHGIKQNKKRLTYAFTVNADGSEPQEPFVIGKAEKPRPFNKKSGEELGFVYRWNAKAWMKGDLFRE